MSHGATFDLSEELTDLFTKEASGDGTLACIFVSIIDEVFTLGATIPLGESAEADFEATKRLLSEDEATRPDYVVVLAWNFARSIIDSHAEFARRGGRWIVPLPDLYVC